MSLSLFIVVLALGAASLALWLDARFPQLAPTQVLWALLHVLLAMLVSKVVPSAFRLAGGSDTSTFLALFGVALPSLLYCLLAALWLMKAMRSTVGGLR